MNNKEIEEYFKIYTLYWKLFKKFSNLDGTDAFWSNLLNESNALHEELQDIDYQLSKDIVIATVTAIDRKYKQKVKEYEDQGRQMDLMDMEGNTK